MTRTCELIEAAALNQNPKPALPWMRTPPAKSCATSTATGRPNLGGRKKTPAPAPSRNPPAGWALRRRIPRRCHRRTAAPTRPSGQHGGDRQPQLDRSRGDSVADRHTRAPAAKRTARGRGCRRAAPVSVGRQRAEAPSKKRRPARTALAAGRGVGAGVQAGPDDRPPAPAIASRSIPARTTTVFRLAVAGVKR